MSKNNENSPAVLAEAEQKIVAGLVNAECSLDRAKEIAHTWVHGSDEENLKLITHLPVRYLEAILIATGVRTLELEEGATKFGRSVDKISPRLG